MISEQSTVLANAAAQSLENIVKSEILKNPVGTDIVAVSASSIFVWGVATVVAASSKVVEESASRRW